MWAPGPVWTGAENLASTGSRSPVRPTRSQSLYRLRYPGTYCGRGYKQILKLATKITNHLNICLEWLSKTTKIHSKGIRYNSECDTTKSSSRPSPVDSARITPFTLQQEMSSYDTLGRCTLFFYLMRQPPVSRASSFTRFLHHTQRSTTVDRTPLDEWLARPRDLYLTIHNIHNIQTSMPRWDSNPQSQQASGRRPML